MRFVHGAKGEAVSIGVLSSGMTTGAIRVMLSSTADTGSDYLPKATGNLYKFHIPARLVPEITADAGRVSPSRLNCKREIWIAARAGGRDTRQRNRARNELMVVVTFLASVVFIAIVGVVLSVVGIAAIIQEVER